MQQGVREMSIQIVSNGTIAGTHICHAVTGQQLSATNICVVFNVRDGIRAVVTFVDKTVKEFNVESIRLSGGPPVKVRRPDPAVEAAARENDKRREAACPECGGTGEVTLLTSTVPCSRGCKG